MFPDKAHKIIAGALFFLMMGIYLMTVAPTISFWDCGEFVTCSYIMGIPHPPGSPLLSLIGRVMSLIPFYDFRGYGVGEIAYRVNMIDVILGALTVMLTYFIMVRLLHKLRPYTGRKLDEAVIMVAAVVTALVAGFSDEFWTNAIEIETYMPSLFMQMLAVWLTLKWDERKDDPKAVRYLFLAAYIIGLGNGVHLTVLLIAPVIVLFVIFSKPEWFREPKLWGTTILFGAAMGFLKMFGGYALFYLLMAMFALVVPYLLYRQYQRTNPAWLITFMGIVFCTSLFIIGYSVYPTVMVRASKNPAINEGNPDTWERYKSYMERDQYGQENMMTGMFTRKASADYQFNYMFLRYLIKQFPKWGPTLTFTFENDRSAENRGQSGAVTDQAFLSIFLLALILYGLYTHAAGDWRRFVPLLLFFFASSVGLVLYLNMENPQVRERPYFFLGAFYIAMYWIGFGMYGVMIDIADWLRTKNREKTAVLVVTVIALAFLTLVPSSVLSNHIDPNFTQYETHDRTGDWAPKDYGYNILVSCDQDGILFTNGDNDTFPLWYLQFVEGFRKDVRVVNLSLLNTPWYILQMKHEGGPVPAPREVQALMADSGQILVDRDVADSLGVLTTNETKTVPINMEDDYIENVVCGEDETAQRRRLIEGEGQTVTAAGIEWYMPAYYQVNSQYSMYRIQDEMVYNIVRWVNWDRPIYFAVTVALENMIGLSDYLGMEGMVYRLMPEKAPEGEELLNADILNRNLFDRYQYHDLADPGVYKPPNTVKLVSNYFVGFAQLTDYFLSQGDPENALRVARGGIDSTPGSLNTRRILYQLFATHGYTGELTVLLDHEFSERDVLRDPTGTLRDRMALYFQLLAVGDTATADEYIAAEKSGVDERSYQDRVDFGTTMIQANLYTYGLAYFQDLVADFPENPEAWQYLTVVAANIDRYDIALDAAERLVVLLPNSSEAVQTRDVIRQLLTQQNAGDSTVVTP